MSLSSQPFHSAIDQCQRSETRSLAAAKKLQANPNDSLAYCEFQTELGILCERLQQCQQAVSVLRHQDQVLAENINNRLAHTQALIHKLDRLDTNFLDDPNHMKQKHQQRNLEMISQSIHDSHQQTKAFFAGTRNSIHAPIRSKPSKLEPLQIPRPQISTGIKAAKTTKGKIIAFPKRYQKSTLNTATITSQHHRCRIISFPISAMNPPANQNTPKP